MPDRDPLQDKPDKPAESMPDRLWPILLVLSVVLVAVGYGVLGHWRRASVGVGAAMLLAGGLRLVLPKEVAGLLVVRRKSFDVACYLLLGLAIAVVAFVVPPAR